MNNRKKAIRRNSGMALLTALLFISITVIVLTAMMGRYVQQRLQVDRFEDYYICFEAAQAAIEQGKAALNAGDFSFRIGIPSEWEPTFDDNNTLIMPGFDETGIQPQSFTSIPDVEYIMYMHEWHGDGRDTNGDGTVDSEAEEGMFSIHAVARLNGVTRRLESVFDTRDFGIWNNAIFAGRGQAGRLINGNVQIHGSVHLLGDDLPDGGVAVEAVDMSGTAMIRNDYVGFGIPGSISSRIPPLRTTLYQGEVVETLNTEFRVRRGIAALSGNSHVGTPFQPGTGWKGPVDGTFVTDGWGGNAGTDNVFSDNSTDTPYDLGDSIALPLFEDDYRDPDTGDRIHNTETGTWYTHAEYFTEVLVGGPDRQPGGGMFNGNLDFGSVGGGGNSGSNDGFYYNATTGEHVEGDTSGVTVNPDHHYIFKPEGSNIIQINGAIHINGNLDFPRDDFYYYGRGSIFVEGEVEVAGTLLPVNSPTNSNDVSHNTFPYISCLGVMSRGRMALGTTSQRHMMGAFYSADNVNLSFQTRLGGTIVGRDFEMGNQVPSIFQVPVLAQNLPLGMIGDFPILRLQDLAWRELGV